MRVRYRNNIYSKISSGEKIGNSEARNQNSGVSVQCSAKPPAELDSSQKETRFLR